MSGAIARILRAFLLDSGLGGASADDPHRRLRRDRPNPSVEGD